MASLIRRIAIVLGLTLQIVSCGGNSDGENTPDAGTALVQVPVEDRRIAIVHSQSTKSNFYDPFAYNQLFASVQHQAMMAGLPFDLLDEDTLASSAPLQDYDAIVFPSFTHVKANDRQAIITKLLQAQADGVGIIASSEFMAFRPDGTSFGDFAGAMIQVLGVQPSTFQSGVSASVKVADNTHPVNRTYQPDEELVSYEQIWFANFVAAAGEQASPITVIDSDGTIFNGAQSIERDSRVVHFANDQILADNNQLWRMLQWVVYGDIAPVGLQVSRSDHVFLARNDMDQAMIAAELAQTEIPLLEIIRDWKRDFNFVGSYYIDIGNDPAAGEFTDWAISGPLYRDYIALGNEIATHSWTHPHFTSTLNASELEFEFMDSAAEIGTRVGVPVTGAAVPGTAESLFVVETLNPWLDYLSGRSGTIGSGYQGAIGFLEPQHDMMYFSLNLSPDFTLIDFLNRTPAQAKAIWKDEIDGVLKHAQQPIVHWLWHDYGPTTQTAAGFYSKDMFTDTIAYANSQGAEFATVEDMQKRIRTFAQVDFSVGSSSVINATVQASDVGQFALKVSEQAKIKSVENWYAYDEDQVFLPEDGGQFIIATGAVADPVTRITELPMRARLLNLSGDGDQLSFSMAGEGEVSIVLSNGLVQNATVTGASSFTEVQGVLTLRFDTNATHTVEITPTNPINRAPVAVAGSLSVESGNASPVILIGTDTDGDALSFEIQNQPLNGVLSGTAPNLLYTANDGFTGTDSFSFIVSDGTLNSQPALIELNVGPRAAPNQMPFANALVLQTLAGQASSFVLSGSDNENQPLTFAVVSAPANGTVSGTIPDLVYTPNPGFVGRDSLEFTVSDSVNVSDTATVVFNVEAQFVPSVGTLSNPISAVVLDGDLTEWTSDTLSFGVDPQDISGANNNIDWREAWMSHDSTHFYIAYREHNAVELLWGNQIFLDTDGDTATGFRGFSGEHPIGSDYLIEGNALFQYDGDLQFGWFWSFVGNVESSVVGDSVELKIDRTVLANPDNLLLFFHGDSQATAGTSLDFYPDGVTDTGAVITDRRFSYSVNPNVVAGNSVPIAFAQDIQLSKDTAYPLVLTGFDADNDPLTYEVVVDPQSGTLSGVAPNLVYTPDPGTSQDLIAYVVSDGATVSSARSVQFFLVDPPQVNNRPAANNMAVEALAMSTTPVTLSGSDVDGDELTYTIVNPPVSGTLSGTPPALSYTASVEVGSDSFTYIVNDGVQDSATATVLITIDSQSNVNTTPQANSLNLTTAFETAIGLELSGSDVDGDTISYQLVSQPALGSLSGTPPQLTYLPFSGAAGTDSFSYIVTDGVNESQVANVVVEVLAAVPANQAPVSNGQSLSASFGQALNVELTGRDPEQSALSYQLVTQPLGGSLSGTPPGLTYTPEAGFSGVDSFTFLVSDGQLESEPATVTIDVAAQTPGPISNSVSSLVVDGDLSDWNGLLSLGTDPADVGGVSSSNPLDWRQAWVAHSTTDIYIAYRNHEAFNLSWGHGVWVDIDGDINTGFRGFSNEFPIGADLLIETDDVQSYIGTGNDWGWENIAAATVITSGEIGELSLPRSAVGDTTELKFYFRANNSAFGGNTVDHFPDAAVDATQPLESRYLPYQLN